MKLEMECLCLGPGYPGNTNELQTVLRTQKSPYLNQRASQVLPSCVPSEDRDLNDKDDGSLRKKPTFRNATNGFPAKRRLRNERRNSVLITFHFPDLGSASDWLKQISHPARPIQ